MTGVIESAEPLVVEADSGILSGTSEAVFSVDRARRYLLVRLWESAPPMTWIMLNPSTADAFAENTRVDPKTGNRNCRTCLAMLQEAWNGKRRGRQVRNRKPQPPKPPRTHCVNGHLLAEVGVYVDKTGKRMCRECIRIRNKRNYRKRQDVVKNETKAA